MHLIRQLACLTATIMLIVGWSISAHTAVPTQPTPNEVTQMANVQRIIAAKRDILGEVAMRRPNGPSYESFVDAIPPLRYTDAEFRCYPIVLSAPGAIQKARLVSNGSAVNARGNAPEWWEMGFPVTFRVGDGEVFGVDLDRLDGPRYEQGYLPIVHMSYRQGDAKYAQEAFASVDPSFAEHGAVFVRFSMVQGKSGRITARLGAEGDIHADTGTLSDSQGKVLIWFSREWTWSDADHELVAITSSNRSPMLAIFTQPADSCPKSALTGSQFREQSSKVVRVWKSLLSRGTNIETPEPRVNDAWRSLVIGSLAIMKGDQMNYSAGNGYERLFFAECSDALRSLLLLGFNEDVKHTITPLLDFHQGGVEFHDAGFKLQTLSHYFWLTRDAEFVRSSKAHWMSEVDRITSSIDPKTGLLPTENYCGDIETQVLSLNSNANSWRGLRDISAVLVEIGDQKEANRLAAIAKTFRATILDAVSKSERTDVQPPFIPNILLGNEDAYDKLTETMMGSYWDLLIPYVLGSGVFDDSSERMTWILDYLHKRGGVCMGMIRFFWNSTDDLYGLRYILTLLRRDEVDRSQVSFYGKLAQGLTHDTFIGGEGCGLAPIDKFGRHACRPPNSASNALFLWHLRYLLIQDWDMDDDGAPDTLRLLFATPRLWLADGKSIIIERAPTMFGELSLRAKSDLANGVVTVHVKAPPHSAKHMLLRARVPEGWKVVSARIGSKNLPLHERDTVDITGQTGEFTVRFGVSRD